MAMFWVGASPKVEIRHDGRFYPACRGKCLPILRWMLSDVEMLRGFDVADSLLPHPSDNEVPIVYEDDDIVVVNKPAGLLSVPGISEKYSVWSIMRHRYRDVDSPLTVHRLDQPTSGLLLIAKTRQAYRALQRQFMQHEVKKKYVALLERDGWQGENEKLIDLPLYSDPLNRPYQSVDYERGKPAATRVVYLGETDGHVRVALYPQTGRTHQLRVHCAHSQGLGNPILGDNLYGSQEASRLYLHAESITFRHPRTNEEMTITAPADF
jgi:tRNA pseudouridine32 synthase/23S rRNA pseudouridine746 synthase